MGERITKSLLKMMRHLVVTFVSDFRLRDQIHHSLSRHTVLTFPSFSHPRPDIDLSKSCFRLICNKTGNKHQRFEIL